MGDPAPPPDPTAPYVFVSYASADIDRVMPLVAALRRAGVPVWLDQHAITGGENYALEIAEAIEGCTALMLICSSTSLASRNVKQEIALAWKYARPYVPLLLETVTIPKDVEYWLEASQWVEIREKPEGDWFPAVLAALAPLGITPTAAPTGETMLAGRERERALLRDRLTRARAGHGSLVLIGGEAGIGKTALAEATLRDGAQQGCVVLEGHCFDLAETPPYGPWIDLFAHLPVAAALPPLPDAFKQRGTVGAVPSQMALFVAVEDFLRALAIQRPVALLLDDLHWSDPASLDLLRFLARSLATLPLLVLVTYRSDELTRRHPLYHLLPQLARDAGAERLDLSRLDDAAVHTLVAARYTLVEADTSRLVAYLQARAEGNALFVGELLRALEEAGTLRRGEAGWAVGALDGSAMPPLLRQVIETRLSRLDTERQRLLAVAAVIGHEVPLAVWATVAESDEETVLAAVEQGLEARLLVEVGSDERVRFAHALIREALYEGIPGIRRRRMHRRIGESLAETRAPDPDAVAYHFQQAGDGRAVTWLMQAGERAQAAYAWVTAAARFEAALALMEGDESNRAERGWLLLRLARMLRYTDIAKARASVDEAMRLATAVNEQGLATYALRQRGLLACFANDIEQGLEDMEAGIAAVDALPPDERARIAVRGEALEMSLSRGTLVLWRNGAGRFREARDLGEQLVAETTSSGDGSLGLGATYAFLGLPDEAMAMFAGARSIYQARGHHFLDGLTVLYELLAVHLPYQTADMTARRQIMKEVEEAMARAGGAITLPARFFLTALLILEGAWEEVRPFESLAHLPGSDLVAVAAVPLAALAQARGEREIAWSFVREWLPAGAATRLGTTSFEAANALQRRAVSLALSEGDLSAAAEWLHSHDHWMAQSGAILGLSDGQALWAQYHWQAGDADKASEHAERALAHATEPRQPLALLAALRLLGELDTDAGRYDDAARHLDASRQLAEACEAPYERALTLLAMAELQAATGDNDAARALITEVKALCEPLGAKPTLARVEALAQRLGAE